MTFAFSQARLSQIRNERFQGSWRFLDKFLHDIPEREATKALMDMALYFRTHLLGGSGRPENLALARCTFAMGKLSRSRREN